MKIKVIKFVNLLFNLLSSSFSIMDILEGETDISADSDSQDEEDEEALTIDEL